MKKKNILIFPCGSEIGLDIHTCLKHSTYFQLIGGSSVDDHGKFVYDKYIPNIPFVTSPDFISKIKSVIKDFHIDAIYPATDMAVTILKQIEDKLGCLVIASPTETTEICLSKSKTYSILKDVVRVPKSFSVNDIKQYPVFIKPDIGHSSIGAEVVKSEAALNHKLKSTSNCLILEYLPGEEYTVDCFTDRHGKLKYAAGRKRNRIRVGISVNTTFVENQDEFIDFAQKINTKIQFRGAWFYQVKRDVEGNLCLLEVASRIGGSSLLSYAKGINLPLLSIFDAFAYDVDITPNNYEVELDRAFSSKYKIDIEFDTIYVDYDDCLILNQKSVNAELVHFLYECLNRGKKIILLSKHDGDLNAELKMFRLQGLFDEIIHLPRDTKKQDYITAEKAIFIDDSFAERNDILSSKHIPVFAPEMINVLM